MHATEIDFMSARLPFNYEKPFDYHVEHRDLNDESYKIGLTILRASRRAAGCIAALIAAPLIAIRSGLSGLTGCFHGSMVG